jgi:hypothetical protein
MMVNNRSEWMQLWHNFKVVSLNLNGLSKTPETAVSIDSVPTEI